MDTLVAEKLEKLTQPMHMTEEEFLEFCDEDTRAEYIDGEVIVHSPVTNKHSRIATFLTTILQLYIDQHLLGIIWGENFQVRPRAGLRRVPDLVFVSTENQVIITNTEVDGAPDLVVEIVSPDSIERDWRVKYLEYEKAGIKEYWVIDPIYEKMNIYCLNEHGKYEAQKAENKILESKVLRGFWIKPEWLWQEPLPNVISVAKELKIKI
jgi:Uma2 family endonuclease